MGVERPDGSEESDALPKRTSSSAAAAKPSSGKGAAALAEDTIPEVVDFDALHAALGDLPPPAPTSSSSILAESQGRTNATYASARPHALPARHALAAADLNAPPVIVATEDTVPSGPPLQMTMPLGRFAGAPASTSVPTPTHVKITQPYVADSVPTHPARPRLRTPTIVVRTRGPSKQQKLLVFVAMLLVFVGGGVAFLIYGKQLGINVDLGVMPQRTAVVATAAPSTPATPTVSAIPSVPPAVSVAPVPPASVSVAPSATAPVSTAKKPRPKQPSTPPPNY
jgi:hypothetical protein